MKRRRGNIILSAFRSLMPHDERFIKRFCAHSQLIVPAAEAFRALMSDDGRAEQHAAEINRLEDAADKVTRETVLAIHRSFITPFDRSQILDRSRWTGAFGFCNSCRRRCSAWRIAATTRKRRWASSRCCCIPRAC